jgi:PKD repeat protein
MFKKRLSSADKEYRSGALSVFPQGKDTPLSLYIAHNNAETELVHSCTSSSKYIVVRDTSKFPDMGIIKLSLSDGTGDPELIHYFKKIGNQFHFLQRGFAGFRKSNWPSGSKVTGPVCSEQHNALKDAVINIQRKIGLLTSPATDSLHSTLNSLENKWLAPKASFRVWPKSGHTPLNVRFQNVSGGFGVKYFWDFGDGSTSTEENPSHIYNKEGRYTIKLNVISASGSQGVAEKSNYIEVDNSKHKPFFYVDATSGDSIERGKIKNTSPTVFTFVDQTDGDIVERDWFFGDGTSLNEKNPNVHTTQYTFPKPGNYSPKLMIRLNNNVILNATISESLAVM